MNTRCLLITAVVGASVLAAWGPSATFGQCEITPVTVDDGVAEQKFGWSTAISGDYAVVGTDEPSSATGAAYLFERDGLSWIEIGRLVPALPVLLANDDEYGRTVAISGSVAAVGARKRDPSGTKDRGAVYVFRRNPSTGVWEYEQELLASLGAEGDLFGSSLAIDGDWIVAGAPNSDVFGDADAGAAYAFYFDGTSWTQKRKFRANDQAAGDQFANAVAINGNWVVVGAKADGDGCPGEPDAAKSGSVYTFFHDPTAEPNAGWEPRTKLQAQFRDGDTVTCDAAFSDAFGQSVAVNGDRLVVGAIFDDDAGISSGSAYVYRLDEADWVIEQKLTASDAAAADNFGRDVAIEGDLVLVSASKGDSDNPSIANTGAVYLYHRSGTSWVDEVKLTPGDAAENDRFGWFVSISGDYAAVGAYRKEDSTGSAYFFAVGTESDCNENGVHDDCEILGDSGLDSNNNGVLDSCECTTDDECVGALPCISGTCDSVSKLCVFTVNAGTCAIAGECSADGDPNPNNDCQACDHATSDSDWSNRAAGLSCGDDSDSTCDHPDTCDGEGLCLTNPEPSGTDCADDGNECTRNRCDGAGDCGHPDVFNSTPCTPDGNECTENQCLSGQCSAILLDAGFPCGNPFNSECNPADTCDGAGTCLDHVKDDGAICIHDGLFCTGEDSCQGGVCISAGDPCTAEGLLCDDNAEAFNECSCDEAVAGVCDDGVFCNGVEACFGGACFSPGDPCDVGLFCEEAGARCVACLVDADCPDDGNECTETVCRDGACEHDALVDDTPCGSDLDDDCTNPDSCAGGTCVPNDEAAGTACGNQFFDTECNPKDSCDGSGTCLDNIPPNDTPCTDDGLFCNGTESCQVGFCESAGDPCAAPGLICDAVAELNDTCSCDGDAACDDGNECTTDVCDSGVCKNEAVPNAPAIACTDDGVFCNGTEACIAGVCSSLGNPCEAGEVCNEGSNICNCNSNDDCAEDGLFCNGEEICSGGLCISAGDPCNSTPATPVCIEATNSCECNSNAHCDNGKFCDGAESCVAGSCQGGTDPCSADESCNEQSDVCEECETGEGCDDGDNCTVDRCPFGICNHETLPECKDDDDDGVINSEDLCPGTAVDAEVDAIGCTCADAIDTDHDGVIDCDDDCGDTPPSESANNSGCSCSQTSGDSDGDGLADDCDDCPGTPSGESVDESGCAQSQLDSDQDGVTDDVDECPGTPSEIEVGDDGCPIPDDNGNDNEPGQGLPNDNDNDNTGGNDNDNVGDNDNDNAGGNDNDNAGGNDNDNSGGGLVPRPCGLFGMLNLVFLGLGMVALRVTRTRHRRCRR